jgi:hypothetical protein
MKTPLVIMEKSAMSSNQKHSILANELVRRLSNTNHEEPDTDDVKLIIETYIQQLKSSGYGRSTTREMVVSGIIGWRRKIARRIREQKPFYRSAESTLKGRCKKKLLEKVSWYKNKRKREDDADDGPYKRQCGDKRRNEMHTRARARTCVQGEKEKNEMQDSVKAVMFVPYTVGSELAKRMRDAEEKLQEMTGYKLKIVERTGTKLVDILQKADPWQGQECGRDKRQAENRKEPNPGLLQAELGVRDVVHHLLRE